MSTPTRGRVAGVSLRPGDTTSALTYAQIETVGDDGSDPRTVSPREHFVQSYDYSPTTRRFVYRAFRSDTLYIVSDTGGAVTRLPTGLGTLSSRVRWSPDGTRIAFAAVTSGRIGLYTIARDGSGLRTIVLYQDASEVIDVAWSPRTDQIAYTRLGALHVVNADGSSQRQLATITLVSRFEWSPDAATIIAENRTSQFHLVDVRGGTTRVLAPACENCSFLLLSNPRWSPDGTRLAFFAQGIARVVRLSDGVVTELGRSADAIGWAPDGRRLMLAGLFRVGPDVAGLATLDADGQNLTAIYKNSQIVLPIWMY